ncbi:MAG: MBL fold metallo-hydrolase, partial [Candidatus Heimdallarchaeota archaeon]|nr:MBL fold metallo-hydrolase [Candidatus Heimdallarchaeota archaeon]
MIEEKRKKLSTHGKFLAPTVLFIRPEVRHYLTSNSLLFLGDQTYLLDSGYHYQGDQLKKIRDAIDIDGILFSHYHIDHVFGCHILPESKKMIHKEEVDTMRSFDNFIQFCFKDQTISSQQRNIWKLRFKNLLKREGINDWSDLRLDNVISFGSNENIDLGVTQLQILHLPGHSPGHCGVY